LPSVEDLLPGFGSTSVVVVPGGAGAAGQTLAALNVRAATGATIIAISRDGQTISMPSGHEPLREGDTLALAGAEHAVEAATRLLTGTLEPAADQLEPNIQASD
jgi:K+/H+ antiporter YhaU regulatory subunit KhtT